MGAAAQNKILAAEDKAYEEGLAKKRPRTMSQVRRVGPTDKELSKAIKYCIIADPDLRFGMKVTMASSSLIVQRLEVRAAACWLSLRGLLLCSPSALCCCS